MFVGATAQAAERCKMPFTKFLEITQAKEPTAINRPMTLDQSEQFIKAYNASNTSNTKSAVSVVANMVVIFSKPNEPTALFVFLDAKMCLVMYVPLTGQQFMEIAS